MKRRIAILLMLLAALSGFGAIGISTAFVPLAPVRVVHPNGTVDGYGFGSANDAARGTAVIAAFAAATAGDTIKLDNATYDIGTNQTLTMPASVSLIGSGERSTVITGSSSGTSPIVRFADNSDISNLSIINAYYDSGTQTGGWAVGAINQATISNVAFRNCYINAYSDGIRSKFGLSVKTVAGMTIDNCDIVSNYDGLLVSGTNVRVYGSRFTSANTVQTHRVACVLPDAALEAKFYGCMFTATNDQNGSSNGAYCYYGEVTTGADDIEFIGCNLNPTNSGTAESEAVSTHASSAKTIRLRNCRIAGSGGGTYYDLKNGAASSITVEGGSGSGSNGTYSSNGTVTYAGSLNASAMASGTVPAARGGAGTINGILKADGSGLVSLAAAGTDYYKSGSTTSAPQLIHLVGGLNTPSASTTYYGGHGGAQPGGNAGLLTTQGATRMIVPYACTVTKAYVTVTRSGGTTGTTETSTVALGVNNVFTPINSAVTSNATATFSNTSMSVAVNAGDYIEFRWATPAWATSPTNVSMSVDLEVHP